MSPFVLHVLPVDLPRGAQTYARELRRRLDGEAVRHRSLTIFAGVGVTLKPDVTLDVPSGALRTVGLDPRAVLRLRRAVREMRPDVVVAHGGEPLKYAVLAGVSRSTLVYYRIGIGSAKLRGAREAFFRQCARRAAVVATVSEDVADDVRSIGVDPTRVVVIPNGRDVAKYGVTHTRPNTDRTRLAFVGRLVHSKRPERFVELVRALRNEGNDIEAVVAGGGELLDAVRQAARDLPIDVLGDVDDVTSVLATSDVFVFTSVPQGEGMPGVLIEAGLASLPIVTTDVPGARDVVEDGVTGFVVAVDDAVAMVDAARRVVRDGALREQMGAAARRRCEDRFGLEQSVEQWRVVLDDLLASACTSST
jgi:glycosyltransferase involved in cell wall biosynthesis